MSNPISLFVSSKDADRHNNINIIRFIAAAMVIYGHMAHLAGYSVPVLFGEEVSGIAVKVFFVLSGYLIMQSYMRDGHLFRYGIRRVFRIFPGLIFVCFITAFVIGPFLSDSGIRTYFSDISTYEYFIKNCIMYPVYNLPGVFTNNYYPTAVNGSLWTLPVEFSMYILLPLFIVSFKKLHILKLGIAFTGVVLMTLELIHIIWYPDWCCVIWGTNIFDGLVLAPYFFIGAVFTFPELKRALNLQWAVVLAFLAGIVVLSSYWQYELLIFLVLPYITLSCSFATPAIFGRVFAINDYSYGLYLWGFFIQQVLVSLIGIGSLSILPYTFICLIASLSCAMVSWHLIEKPGNALGKRLTAWSRSRQRVREAKDDC